MKEYAAKQPSPWVSVLPLAVLTLLLYVVIRCFGGDAINGGSQIALLSATSVCVMLAIGIYRCKWAVLEEAIIDNIRASASAIIILLLIGAIAGSWMVSGVVPTMIYYGLKILHPSFFLVASCVICAGVSLMTGSSWTTIATIGVALMGIGQAMGFPEGWIAGAIISGAYFGDKLSLLSDTTVLASSTVGVPIFTHIRYMLYTTVPSFVIALAVFVIAGLTLDHTGGTHAGMYAESLRGTFRITPWLLAVLQFVDEITLNFGFRRRCHCKDSNDFSLFASGNFGQFRIFMLSGRKNTARVFWMQLGSKFLNFVFYLFG